MNKQIVFKETYTSAWSRGSTAGKFLWNYNKIVREGSNNGRLSGVDVGGYITPDGDLLMTIWGNKFKITSDGKIFVEKTKGYYSIREMNSYAWVLNFILGANSINTEIDYSGGYGGEFVESETGININDYWEYKEKLTEEEIKMLKKIYSFDRVPNTYIIKRELIKDRYEKILEVEEERKKRVERSRETVERAKKGIKFRDGYLVTLKDGGGWYNIIYINIKKRELWKMFWYNDYQTIRKSWKLFTMKSYKNALETFKSVGLNDAVKVIEDMIMTDFCLEK